MNQTAQTTKVGEQVMDCSGLNRKDNTWRNVGPKKCGCCGAPSVFLDINNEHHRVESCDDCTAMNIDFKGGWGWSHGWRLPKDWPAQFLAGLSDQSGEV